MSIFGSLSRAWRRRWWRPDQQTLAAFAGLRPMVVVTGGSEGIGLALAKRFAGGGNDILLIARRPEPLEHAAASIRVQYKVEVVAFPLDVAAADAIARIDAELARLGAYADVLVNSAGVGLSGPFVAHSPEAIDRLVELNVRALTSLTRHYLAGMQARGRGGILNVASLGGYAPGPYQAAYYATKAYVLSLTEALAYEAAGLGVRVCALAPGPVRTLFHQRMGRGDAFYLHALPVPSPDSVARAGYLGYLLALRVTVPGLMGPFLAVAMKIIPHRILVPIVGWLLKPRELGLNSAERKG